MLQRYQTDLSDDQVDLSTAQEMARVGIIPTHKLRPIGTHFVMAGQNFTVIGEATREEFLAAVIAAGLGDYVQDFKGVPADYAFERITTD